VIGAVADIQAVAAKDAVTAYSTTPANYVLVRNLEHTAGLRARIGYGFGPALVYATGGVAYGKVDNRFLTSNGANSFTARADEDDADGTQFGGGIEWSLAPNLTLVTEYLYTDLEAGDHVVRVGPGTAPATNPFILPPNAAGTDLTRSSDAFKFHAFRLGFNVRF
jgi:outer membrane immunogenic protein